MRMDGQDTFGAVLEALDLIWRPGMEAMNLQRELKLQSLEDTVAAAERAGYDVCYLDLPDSVGGFATVLEGRPLIGINRAKPRSQMLYTVSHELGHQILHLNPSPRPVPFGIPLNEGMQELQAHMFAASWVFWVAKGKEREDVLKQNPESFILVLSMFLSLGVIVTAVGLHLWSRMSKGQLSKLPVTKQ